MTEKIDHLAGLSDRLTADAPSHHSAQWHLLPYQHPELVGGPVGLGVGDVGDEADQVEPGVSGSPHVGGDLARCRIAGAWVGGQHHDALEHPELTDNGLPQGHGLAVAAPCGVAASPQRRKRLA